MPEKILVMIDDPNMLDRAIAFTCEETGKDLTLVALNKDVKNRLKGKNQSFKTAKDYGLSTELLKEEGLSWFRSLAHIDLKYEDILLWWLVEQPLYFSKFAYPSVMNIIMQTIMFNRIIETEKPTIIYYPGNNLTDLAIIELICKTVNIDFINTASRQIRGEIQHRIRALAYIWGQWFRIFLRKTYWLLLNLKYKPLSFNNIKNLLLFSPAVWTNIRDLNSGELRKGDPHLNEIIVQLKNEYRITGVDVPSGDWGLKIMRNKIHQQQFIFKPFESYISLKTFLKAFKTAGKLHGEYNKLQSLKGLKKHLSYNGIPLYSLLEANFSLFFSSGYLAMMLAYIELAKRMISEERPSAIIHYGDLPDCGRAVFAISKTSNIPSILLQHGLYDNYSPYFNHLKSDIGDNSRSNICCPIPDKFAISDSYTRNILVKRGNFPESDVIITGQPRYDIMAYPGTLLDKQRTLKTLNLDPEKKLVAWMTATHGYSRRENERYISCVYGAINSLGNTQLLIKLHPGENQKALLYRKNKTLKPTIVNKYSLTTFELLNAADVIITNGYCSTSIEAIILNKPVINLDFSDNLIPPYVSFGASIGIFKEESLIPSMKDTFNNENICKDLTIARKKFINEFGYENDGKATQRVIDLIIEMTGNIKGDGDEYRK
ncbi:MAG: CDP-glycerol glycerophosphotransferase family protein [Dehalococcoidales bacterium]|nr:CDP-glycerol glycerophosphotransferase family protein [Dehalococcoidales bacterium]